MRLCVRRITFSDDKMMRYFPEDLSETERWIYEVFEPIRRAYFEQSFERLDGPRGPP